MQHAGRIAMSRIFVAMFAATAAVALAVPATGVARSRTTADYPVYHVANSGIGVRLRHSPHAGDTYPNGVGPHDGNAFQLVCQDWGDPMGTRDNHIWDYIYWAGYTAWIPDVWTDTPAPANQYSYTHPCPASVGGSGGGTPPLATTTISGTVTCAGHHSVVGVWVSASAGGSGWASWSPVPGAPYQARYSKSVTGGGLISLHVGCGGTPQRWWSDNATPSGAIGSGTLDAVCNEASGTGTRCTVTTNQVIENAIAWAQARQKNRFLDYYCFTMVWDAYKSAGLNIGTPPAPDYAAWDWWASRPSAQHVGDQNPPRGALVFWSWSGWVTGKYRNWGHVGISLGNGQVISTAFNGVAGIHVFSLASALGGYQGWIAVT
jgi:hypothetical protein